jgi:hypothetical protein
VCDVAYVLLMEALERRSIADWQAAAFSRAIGGGGDLPDLGAHIVAQRDGLDAALVAAPVPAGVDREQMELRRALGVA